jgi:transposase
MIQLTAQMRILVAVEPVDFRRGIDGMCRVCRQILSSDPFSGAVFVFRSRRGTAIKILAYDGQGFWLCQKRLSHGRFDHWPRSGAGDEKTRQLLAHQVQVLLMGGNPEATQAASPWRSVTPDVAAA